MWYVIWTTTGQEDKCRAMINRYCAPECFSRIAIPGRKESRKVNGKWETRTRVLFPGYVFIESSNVEELALQLRSVNGFNKILQTEKYYNPLNEAEVRILQRLIGDNDVLEISKGIMVGSRIKVLEGPFVGLESLIKKVDRHKRCAVIEVEMFGRKTETRVGLEILEKVEE